MKLPMGGATPPAQNAIESFSVDFRHSHVHTAITTTQLEFSGTLSNSVGQIGQIPLGFVAFDGDMTKQTNSCAEEIARLTGEDDNTGDDMPGVGAVKSTPSIDVTKEVPADSARPSRGCTHRQEAPQWLASHIGNVQAQCPLLLFLSF
ncbi:hypothetical protein YC2023_050687 [Brassica napus]